MANLAFVAPEIAVPFFTRIIKADLAPESFQSVSQEDVEIWKTPEGTLYHDGERQKRSIVLLRLLIVAL